MRNLNSHREDRDSLLTKIAKTLSSDERFLAGWLTGSYGRNNEDAVSDIDISLVVSDEHSEKLCQRLERVSDQTIPERFSLFSQFGKPAIIHENNNNAPEGGTFTFVLYTESALMMDWVLIPHLNATRPSISKLLFDKVGIPVSPAAELEDLEESKKYVAEQWAFFWMMAAVTIKYIIRNDSVFAAEWIENLHGIVHEIERRIEREPWGYTRGSLSKLQPTLEKQIESIHQLCRRIFELRPLVKEFIGRDPATPLAEIETLLSLINQSSIVNPKS
ncbi:MAG: aminoglycoside 6-adenylyltransferase [Anaerolineales bacterium]|nr:aminoglycoside 6-adenylyltransferase [Anaerolineales bacterium]